MLRLSCGHEVSGPFVVASGYCPTCGAYATVLESEENPDTIEVLDDGKLLHMPGRPGYTLCGVHAEEMKRDKRPVNWAGVWCTGCMLTAVGPRRPCPPRGVSQR
jgi:hypothetical protein